MDHPKHLQRMSHFDSAASTEQIQKVAQQVNASSHFSDRVRCALEEKSDDKERAAKGGDSEEPKPKGPEQPGKADGAEGKNSAVDHEAAADGGESDEAGGDESPTAPEPTKKTPQELNEDPANAVFGEEPSTEKEQNFGPHTGKPQGEIK